MNILLDYAYVSVNELHQQFYAVMSKKPYCRKREIWATKL